VSDLLELALQAHGGLDRWRQIQALDVRLSISGALYELKGFPEGLPHAAVRLAPLRPSVTILPYLVATARGHFTPERVWIEDADGRIVDERSSPRASFVGHGLRTPWDQLQRLYFTGYAMWNYLTLPFLLANSGVVSQEIDPHRENGDVWRRLQVRFPPQVPTHCAEQVLYFDAAGRLQRLDYVIDVAGATVAHFCYDHAAVSGLVFPTLHRVVRRTSTGPQLSGPTGVLLQVQVSNFVAW
jgi:hypothetical protein